MRGLIMDFPYDPNVRNIADQYMFGAHISAPAPLVRIPLYVRAGAIIPIGPEIQYADEKPDAPITLYVYTGRDGVFTLYEDTGTDYGYEKGAFATVRISYDESHGALTLGPRTGAFPGMVSKRTFNVRWISPGTRDAANFSATPDQTAEYSGAQLTIHRRGAPSSAR
jgi:alpha-D-xyloside xylohydrolase